MLKIFTLFISIILMISCNFGNDTKQLSYSEKDGKQIELLYAKGFKIKDYADFKLVSIHNPWQGADGVKYNYVLIDSDQKLPSQFNDYTIIKTPINRIICLSTTHIAFIDVLNKTQTIVGVSGSDYVNNLNIRSAIKNKLVSDVGYDSNLNYELIASLKPDLVMTYGVGSQVSSYNQKLNDMGIKTIINAEYLENHPLGKLEWIKLIGCFYHEEKAAKDYFDKIANEYNSLLNLTKDVKYKPSVLFGLPWKDVWYVPGGNSYLAKMVEHAGGEYIWSKNESCESLPFDIESVFVNASEADIWLNTGTVNAKDDILKIDERFIGFAPFKRGKIYNNNLQINEYGGNNYWESGLTEPQIVLKDMIKIFHSSLLPDHELVYYKNID